MKRVFLFGALAVVPLACLSSLDERDLDKGAEAGAGGGSGETSSGGSGDRAGTGGNGESGGGSGNSGRGGSVSGNGGSSSKGGSAGSSGPGSGGTQGGDAGADGSGDTSGSSGSGAAGGSGESGSAGTGGDAAGGGTDGGGTAGVSGAGGVAGAEPDACEGEREAILAPRDTVSMGSVIVLSGTTDRVVYIDATAGGAPNAVNNSWTYLALATATRVELADTEAATSVAWDIAFKREAVRLNGGDSGPGRASAARLANRSYESITLADLSNATFTTDDWMSDDCVASLDALDKPLTVFSPWYFYDDATMRLDPLPDTFLVKDAADNVLYRFEFQSYYSTETGAEGASGARYRVRFEALAAES